MLLCRLGKLVYKSATADRLHYPDGNVVLLKYAALLICALKRPVKIVELDEAKLHLVSVKVEEGPEGLGRCVRGKAKVLYSSPSFLLKEVVDNAVLLVKIYGKRALSHVVKKIEIKVFYITLFKLLLKNNRRVIVGQHLMTRILGGKIVAVAGILLKNFANHYLGHSAMVGVCGVKIIDAAFYSLIYHLLGQSLVYASVLKGGKTHRSKAERRKLFILKIYVFHSISPQYFFVLL